jgi:hypothetical protein
LGRLDASSSIEAATRFRYNGDQPLRGRPESTALRHIRAGYETAMKSQRVDVTIKRQNTTCFLDHVAKALKLD